MGIFIVILSECEIFIDWQLAVKDLSGREYPFYEVLQTVPCFDELVSLSRSPFVGTMICLWCCLYCLLTQELYLSIGLTICNIDRAHLCERCSHTITSMLSVDWLDDLYSMRTIHIEIRQEDYHGTIPDINLYLVWIGLKEPPTLSNIMQPLLPVHIILRYRTPERPLHHSTKRVSWTNSAKLIMNSGLNITIFCNDRPYVNIT